MKKEKILIVEDEGVIAIDMQNMLTGLGYRVVGIAFCGNEAVAKAKETSPDLVLMDVVLKEGEDGDETAKQIRAWADIPIVYITAYGDDETLSRIKATEPSGYILKPFEERELQIAVDVALYKHKIEKKLRENEQWLATILRSIGEGVIVTDARGFVTFMNPVAALLTEWKEQDAVGRRLDEIFTVVDQRTDIYVDPTVQIEQNIRITPIAYSVLVSKTGRKIPVYHNATPIKSDGGQSSGTVLFFRDITILRRAQESLRQSERKYRSLVECSKAPIVMMDHEWKLVSFNQAFLDTFGYTKEETEHRSIRMIHPTVESYHIFNKKAYPALQKDRVFRTEWDFILKDSTVLPFETIISTIQDNEGSVTGYVAIMRDIIERKKLENALKESEYWYRTIFENTGTSTLTFEDDLMISMVNTEFTKLTGFSKEEIEHKRNWTEFVFPDDHERMKGYHRLRRVEPNLAPREFEFRLVDRHGNVRNVFMTVDVIPGTRKSVASLLDITERKRMDQALRESEERFRILTEKSLVGVYLVQDGRLRYVNDAFVQIHGYTRDEIVDTMGQLDFVVPEERGFVEESIRRGIPDDSDSIHFMCRVIRKDGHVRHVEIFGSRTMYDGQPAELGTVLDVTERVELEEQLRQAQKMESIGTLAGGVAHDFNNILTVIIGSANLLQMKMPDDGSLTHYLNQILTAAEKATQLTQSLLAFSRRQIINLKLSDVNGIVRNTERLLARLIGEDIELRTEYEDDTLTVLTDELQIGQVLINLAANARDAMPQGGVLTIRTDSFAMDKEFARAHGFGKPGAYAVISVRDTGCGIDETNITRIFDPFFTTKEVGKGTGLGLSIAYGIVKQHEGFIVAESKVGEGSTFAIYLPLSKGTAEQARDILPDLSLERGDETLLVAEDNEGVRELMRNILENHGYTVLEARDGEEALRVFEQHRDEIDLIILDVVMPKMNGRQVHSRVKRLKPTIKVIFTSGYTRDIIYQKGLSELDFHYIPKPLAPKELLSKVRKVLDQKL